MCDCRKFWILEGILQTCVVVTCDLENTSQHRCLDYQDWSNFKYFSNSFSELPELCGSLSN